VRLRHVAAETHACATAEILWGVWPSHWRSWLQVALLARFLCVWLVINGFAYVILSFTGLLIPQHQNEVLVISQPALIGELVLMLWLVIKGAKPPALHAATSSSQELMS
jgi:hypothetical protein